MNYSSVTTCHCLLAVLLAGVILAGIFTVSPTSAQAQVQVETTEVSSSFSELRQRIEQLQAQLVLLQQVVLFLQQRNALTQGEATDATVLVTVPDMTGGAQLESSLSEQRERIDALSVRMGPETRQSIESAYEDIAGTMASDPIEARSMLAELRGELDRIDEEVAQRQVSGRLEAAFVRYEELASEFATSSELLATSSVIAFTTQFQVAQASIDQALLVEIQGGTAIAASYLSNAHRIMDQIEVALERAVLLPADSVDNGESENEWGIFSCEHGGEFFEPGSQRTSINEDLYRISIRTGAEYRCQDGLWVVVATEESELSSCPGIDGRLYPHGTRGVVSTSGQVAGLQTTGSADFICEDGEIVSSGVRRSTNILGSFFGF